jgi:hypothetical protein
VSISPTYSSKVVRTAIHSLMFWCVFFGIRKFAEKNCYSNIVDIDYKLASFFTIQQNENEISVKLT